MLLPSPDTGSGAPEHADAMAGGGAPCCRQDFITWIDWYMNKGALQNPPRTEGLACPLLLAPPYPPAAVFGLLISMPGCGSSLKNHQDCPF